MFWRRIGMVMFAGLLLAGCAMSGQPSVDTTRREAITAAEWGLVGDGSERTEPMEIPAGTATITCTYDGPGTFSLAIVDATGTTVQQVTSTPGQPCGSHAVTIPATGQYELRIEAESTWEINVSYPQN